MSGISKLLQALIEGLLLLHLAASWPVAEAATCSESPRYPYYFGMNTTEVEDSMDTEIQNFLVLDDLSVLVHLKSESLAYFQGGTDHGTLGSYMGLLRTSDDSYSFKTGFRANQDLTYLDPAIMAVQTPGQEVVGIVYTGYPSSFVPSDLRPTLAFRFVDTTTGAVLDDRALAASFLRTKELLGAQNTMAVFRGFYLFFTLNYRDSSTGRVDHAFIRVNFNGENHLISGLIRLSEESSLARKVNLIRLAEGEQTSDNFKVFLAAGAQADASGSWPSLSFIDANIRVTTSDHSVVSSLYDTEAQTQVQGGSSVTTALEVVGLVIRVKDGFVEAITVAQAQCDLEQAEYPVDCSSLPDPSSLLVAASRFSFTGSNSLLSSEEVFPPGEIPSAFEGMVVLDGTMMDSDDVVTVWLVHSEASSKVAILKVEAQGSSSLGYTYLEPRLAGEQSQLAHFGLSLLPNVNFAYFSAVHSSAGGQGELTVLLAANHAAGSEFRDGQGVLLALSETTSTSCLSTDQLNIFDQRLSSLSSNSDGLLDFIQSGTIQQEQYTDGTSAPFSGPSSWQDEAGEASYQFPEPQRGLQVGHSALFNYCSRRESLQATPAEISQVICDSRIQWGIPEAQDRFQISDEPPVHFISIETNRMAPTTLLLERQECIGVCEAKSTCGHPEVLKQELTAQLPQAFSSGEPATGMITSTYSNGFGLVLGPSLQAGLYLICTSFSIEGLTQTFLPPYDRQTVALELLPQGWFSSFDASARLQVCSDQSKFDYQDFSGETNLQDLPVVILKPGELTISMQLPIHAYPRSCLIEDAQMKVVKSDGSEEILSTSIGAAPSTDLQESIRLKNRAFSEVDDSRFTNLAWLLNKHRVNLALQFSLEDMDSGEGFLAVNDFIESYTSPSPHPVFTTPDQPSSPQSQFREMKLKFDLLIQNTLVTIGSEQSLYIVQCGDAALRPVNGEDVLSQFEQGGIVQDPRTGVPTLRADVSAGQPISLTFKGHSFCTDSGCGDRWRYCQDSAVTGVTHKYQALEWEETSASWVPSTLLSVSLSDNLAASYFEQTWTVSFVPSKIFENQERAKSKIQFVNGFRSGETSDVIEFDLMLCYFRWLTFYPNPYVYELPASRCVFASSCELLIDAEHLPVEVIQSPKGQFSFIEDHPGISASVVREVGSSMMTFSIATTNNSYIYQTKKLIFEAENCFQERVVLSLDVQFYLPAIDMTPLVESPEPLAVSIGLPELTFELANYTAPAQVLVSHQVMKVEPSSSQDEVRRMLEITEVSGWEEDQIVRATFDASRLDRESSNAYVTVRFYFILCRSPEPFDFI